MPVRVGRSLNDLYWEEERTQKEVHWIPHTGSLPRTKTSKVSAAAPAPTEGILQPQGNWGTTYDPWGTESKTFKVPRVAISRPGEHLEAIGSGSGTTEDARLYHSLPRPAKRSRSSNSVLLPTTGACPDCCTQCCCAYCCCCCYCAAEEKQRSRTDVAGSRNNVSNQIPQGSRRVVTFNTRNTKSGLPSGHPPAVDTKPCSRSRFDTSAVHGSSRVNRTCNIGSFPHHQQPARDTAGHNPSTSSAWPTAYNNPRQPTCAACTSKSPRISRQAEHLHSRCPKCEKQQIRQKARKASLGADEDELQRTDQGRGGQDYWRNAAVVKKSPSPHQKHQHHNQRRTTPV